MPLCQCIPFLDCAGDGKAAPYTEELNVEQHRKRKERCAVLLFRLWLGACIKPCNMEHSLSFASWCYYPKPWSRKCAMLVLCGTDRLFGPCRPAQRRSASLSPSRSPSPVRKRSKTARKCVAKHHCSICLLLSQGAQPGLHIALHLRTTAFWPVVQCPLLQLKCACT